MQEILS